MMLVMAQRSKGTMSCIFKLQCHTSTLSYITQGAVDCLSESTMSCIQAYQRCLKTCCQTRPFSRVWQHVFCMKSLGTRNVEHQAYYLNTLYVFSTATANKEMPSSSTQHNLVVHVSKRMVRLGVRATQERYCVVIW